MGYEIFRPPLMGPLSSLHFHPSDVKKGIGGKKMAHVKELVPRGFLGELRLASAINQH